MLDLKHKIETNPLFKQAFTLSHGGHRADYERLEFLGDRVLGLCIAEMLYRRFPQEQEGALAHRFTDLVREETLAIVARQLDIPRFLITKENSLRHNDSILADVCEALIGAVFLNDGFEAARTLITQNWQSIMLSYRQAPKDPKSALQEWTQKHFGQLPVYKLIGRSGPDHAPIFHVEVRTKGHCRVGQGSSKKAAEQAAAKLLWEEFTA